MTLEKAKVIAATWREHYYTDEDTAEAFELLLAELTKTQADLIGIADLLKSS